jgi:hypothetical protein
MRRSLFETYSNPPSQKPRLRPNFYARLAQFSYANAWLVLCVWLIISAGLLTTAIIRASHTPQVPLRFSTLSEAQKNLATLTENFPNLNALIALNITNSDSTKLKQDRDSLIAKLNENPKDFELVFSPGAGAYYDTHAILYHSLDEVKARVAYAQSLNPLFSAIAEAPTTGSLATLVNEVSASIELGRDPQGLDALFSESAAAVQALMQGAERQVNWPKVAGLDVEPQPTSALIFIMPPLVSERSALVEINKIVDAFPKSEGTTTIVDQPSLPNATIPLHTSNQVLPGLIMMGIFLIFLFFILLGDFALSALIALPSICAVAMLYGLIAIGIPNKAIALWPLAVAVGILTTQLSTRSAFSMISGFHMARSKESAIMLSAQRQGAGLSLLGAGSIAVWAVYFLIQDDDFAKIATVMMAVTLLSLLLVLSLIPACVRLLPNLPIWRAEEWVFSAYNGLFNNRMWRWLRRVFAAISIAIALYGFWFSTGILKQNALQDNAATVNLVSHSTGEAEAIVAKLKSVPQAQAARWLGAFLPQQVDEKRSELQKLKGSFQKITPLIPTATDILRDQISTLNESLLAIANSPATRPELRQSAQEFRRSMELLTATSSDKDVRAFENRIFGSFNVVAEQAETLASLDRPSLATLDPKLRAFFLSPSDVYRIEVTPAPGVTNASLAQKLAALHLPVAHSFLVSEESAAQQKKDFTIILAALATVIVTVLALATRERGGFFASISVLVVGAGVLAAVTLLLKPSISAETLLSLAIFTNFIICIFGNAFLKTSQQHSANSDALHGVEAWFPALLLAAVLAPSLLLNLEPPENLLLWLTVVIAALTCVTAFLLRPITIFLRGGRTNR